MTAFSKKKILVIHSQQPWNQYAGAENNINDSEQFWMRKLVEEIASELKTTGHDIRVGPVGDAKSNYQTNVTWANLPENADADLLISAHSNATGLSEARAQGANGIGIYHHPKSAIGAELARKLLPFLKPVSAQGNAYIKTIEVAEVASTKPPALLVEHEFHDWRGSSTSGGSNWLRSSENRLKIARAYRAFVVSIWGDDEEPPAPIPQTEAKFKFGQVSGQLARFGGLQDDSPRRGEFLRNRMDCSLYSLTEVNEENRKAIIKELPGYKTYPVKCVAVMWDSRVWAYTMRADADSITFGTEIHGAIRVEVIHMATGLKMDVIAIHVLPSVVADLEEKQACIRKALSKLYRKGAPTIFAGDFNTGTVDSILKPAGFLRATPKVDTMDISGEQKMDAVFMTPEIEQRGFYLINPGPITDHMNWIVKGGLK